MASSEKTDGTGKSSLPVKDELETALGAAAEAGNAEYDTGDIAADDAGASKLSTDIDHERKLPTDTP